MEASFADDNQTTQALAELLARVDQELAAGQAQADERRLRHRAAISQLKVARGTLSDLAWELEDLEQRLRDLQAQRAGADDPLVEREVTSMLGRRAALEEQVLTHMLRVDELAANVAAEEQALEGAGRTWAARADALQAERAQIAARLATE